MKVNPYLSGLLRKRPMCWAAIGFLLILEFFILGRSYDEVLYQNETGTVLLEGTITDKQYKESAYGDYWQITVKKVRILQEPEWVTEGKYLCKISSGENVQLKIGQRVLLEGTYAMWEEPTNPGQFNAGKYYCSLGILGQFKKCKVIQQESSYSVFREKMWKFRQEMQELLNRKLGEKDGAIVSAMLLGEKGGLDEEDKNLYQRNGISHILAISGLHLMLLGTGVVKGLKIILGGNKRAAFSAIFIMSSYCVFTGNSISTIRATIMFALSLIAGMLGRSYDSLSALGVSAILQLFMNPYVLNNSGFLLSFLAVVGVTFVAPKLQEMMETKRKISKSLCVSLSAAITTLPVLLCNYGTYPWYSVILNLLILPPMSVLLFLAVVLITLGRLMEFVIGIEGGGKIALGTIGDEIGTIEVISDIAACGMKWILEYFEICCNFFEKLGFREGYSGSPTILQIVIYVCIVAVAMSGIMKHSLFFRKMILLSAFSILTINLRFGMEVTMLDVGQGDSIVIRNVNGNIYISDCGSTSVSKVGKYRLMPFLKHKGYGRIKGIFVSHLDEDHKNGIVELLELALTEKIKIEYLFLSESVLNGEESRKALEELKRLAKRNETRIVYLAKGDKIEDGNMKFLCLYPGMEESPNNDRNNQSMVLYLEYRDFDILLTGDIEKNGELEIAKAIDQISLDVLKVAHHGSAGSSCEEILEKLNPKLSLISCGRNNSYGHPHEETLERLEKAGSEVMTTVESGAVTLKIGRKIKVYEFKK